MSFGLEWKKVKRTGFLPAFLGGGILAAAVPVINMAVRSQNYLGLDDPPVQILMDANWQMMAMLNLLLVMAGCCLMYHTEYADNAIQKMCTLPIRQNRLFFEKAVLMAVMCAGILAIELAGMAFCVYYWFGGAAEMCMELVRSFGYALLLMLPAALAFLMIASACRDMWVSLGIGVVCVFTAAMLPVKSFGFAVFPFALPFQVLAGTAGRAVCHFMIAAVIELAVFAIAEILFLEVRRLVV